MPIKLDKQQKGPGFWKFNCTLLEDQEYNDLIINCISECAKDNEGTEEGLLWETMKCRIRGTSIKYSAAKKRTRNDEIKNLEIEINTLKEEIVNSTDPETVNTRIQEIDSRLNQYRREKTMGNIIRSKCQNYELGEKGTHYFHSLEKRNQENKNIKVLIQDNGNIINNPQDILDEEVNVY